MADRLNYHQIEKDMQKLWKEQELYKFHFENQDDIFSIDTPPPTVSGKLHIGHIFSYTQAEIIARFMRMQGKNVFYPFGFDDNGLPTERLVEKELGIRGREMERGAFTQKCMEAVVRYEEEFKQLFTALGFSVDWDLAYQTIGPDTQKISQQSFLDLAKAGRAYRKSSPVLWCTDCRTSISQAELYPVEKETTYYYLPFAVGGDRLSVATTRPELLYGCVALFVHPDDERYAQYIGDQATVPLYGYTVPILADSSVEMEKSSGVVMCATFGDTTDLELYTDHRLPYRQVICPDGTIHPDVPQIGGMTIPKARAAMLARIQEEQLLLKTERLTHTISVHERCGREVEILPSDQWFIDILSQKESFIQAADQINWYPASMKTRYRVWVENLKYDWCISRQRYFGVPFPVWYCKKCGKPVFADSDQLPVDPSQSSPKHACDCGCSEFLPETAVMDTWATSSLTPMINARYGLPGDRSQRILPMSMRTQAHEIIRTWAFYSIVKSLFHTGDIPWKDIMVCGLVLSNKGEKFSKSKADAALTPAHLIELHSADTIRYWAANSKIGTDTVFSEEDLKASYRFINKLTNAAKFAISHLGDYDPSAKIFLPVDRWIMERCRQAMAKASELLYRYEIGAARHEIDDFFWKDLCDNYLEIVKDRLYHPENHGNRERRSAQGALYYCLLATLKMYAIYTPHITEYLYQDFFKRHEKTASIHLLRWEQPGEPDSDLLSFGETLKDILSSIRKYKSEKNLSMKAELGRIVLHVSEKKAQEIGDTMPDLYGCCHADTIEVCIDDTESIEIEEAWI